jgi:plastocyanin
VARRRPIVITAAVGLALVVTACGDSTPTASPSGQTSGASTPTATATRPTPTARGVGQASGLGTAAASVAATADFMFDPSSVSVKTGAVIQWTNMGAKPCDVTFEPGSAGEDNSALTSPTLQHGDTWQIKIFVPGTYAYLSTLHSGMIGHVIVST